MRLLKNEQQINEVLNKCDEGINEGSKLPGMSFEEGVKYAIEWLTENGMPHPFER